MCESVDYREEVGDTRPSSPDYPICSCHFKGHGCLPTASRFYALSDGDSSDEDEVSSSDQQSDSNQSPPRNFERSSEATSINDKRFATGRSPSSSFEKRDFLKKDSNIDNNRRRTLPRSQNSFFQHDLRLPDEEVEEVIISGNLGLKETKGWSHDLYVEEEQRPKSRQEIVDTYGYDIRSMSHSGGRPTPKHQSTRKGGDGQSSAEKKMYKKSGRGDKCAVVNPRNFLTSSKEFKGGVKVGRPKPQSTHQVNGTLKPATRFNVSQTEKISSLEDKIEYSTSTCRTAQEPLASTSGLGERKVGNGRTIVNACEKEAHFPTKVGGNAPELLDTCSDCNDICECFNMISNSELTEGLPASSVTRSSATWKGLTMLTMKETMTPNSRTLMPAQPELYQALISMGGLPPYHSTSFTIRLDDTFQDGELQLFNQVWSGDTLPPSFSTGPASYHFPPQIHSEDSQVSDEELIKWSLYEQPTTDFEPDSSSSWAMIPLQPHVEVEDQGDEECSRITWVTSGPAEPSSLPRN